MIPNNNNHNNVNTDALINMLWNFTVFCQTKMVDFYYVIFFVVIFTRPIFTYLVVIIIYAIVNLKKAK